MNQPPPNIAGRVWEQARLADMLRGTVEGRPSAAILRGEAGVGKTALARSMAESARLVGFQVLWGTCLRFDAENALLLPLTMALERWVRDAEDGARESVVADIPDVGAVLPILGPVPHGMTTRAPMMIVDSLIDHALTLGPVVLVVDDVQWADETSLMCLSYLIAGFSHQQLMVMVTVREEDLPRMERVRTWLGDVHRLPGVEVMSLERLDWDATQAQVTELLGTRPQTSFIDRVFACSRGNPYLTELLVSNSDRADNELTESLPDALRDALLTRCEGLTSLARLLVHVLAVGGRPAELPPLAAVFAALRGTTGLTAILREAIDAGVVVRDGAVVWLRHPLLADLLQETLLDEEVAPIHAAWSQVLSRRSYEGIEEVRRLNSLAMHCEAAGDPVGAFEASVKAADLAEESHSPGEIAPNLIRAARLWESGAPDPTHTSARLGLLERTVAACNGSDRAEEAMVFVTQALDLVDEAVEPLRASRLLMHVADIAWETGERDTPPVDIVARAVEFASAERDSPEHAEALCMLSNGLRWSGQLEQAASRAVEALEAARRSTSPKAIAKALDSRAGTRTSPALADVETRQALEYALQSGDDASIGYAFGARALVLRRLGRHQDLADVLRRSLDHALAHDRGAAESSQLVDSLLVSGDLSAAAIALRLGLSLRSKASWAARLRLHGAVLAARQGDLRSARLHRTRAHELMPSLEHRLGFSALPDLAEVLLAEGRPDAALALAHEVLSDPALDAASRREGLLWGARAAADLTELGHDTRDTGLVSQAQERLGALFASSDDTIIWTEEASPLVAAFAALVRAERGRASGDEDLAGAWHRAARLCSPAGLIWEEHVAHWRLGAECVRRQRAGTEAAASLRTAHQYAVEQGANALREQVERTAQLGRISLDDPTARLDDRARPAAFSELTAREVEVLRFLTASRTNAEIAHELFISAKTVSVHVSNLLRKTSTTSRRELAALALRLGWPDQPTG